MKPTENPSHPMVIKDNQGEILANYDEEMIDAIKNTVAKDATDAELYVYLQTASMYGLNPFMKEIWFAKTKKGQPMIMASRDGYRKLAMRDERFVKCQSMEVRENDEFSLEYDMGDIVGVHHKLSHKDRGRILGAYAVLKTTTDEDLCSYVDFKEYSQPREIWKKYPSAMIRKVAENDVYKRFVDINGVNDVESMPSQYYDDVAEEELSNSDELETIDVAVVNKDEPTCFTDLLGYDDEEKEAVESAKETLAKEMFSKEEIKEELDKL